MPKFKVQGQAREEKSGFEPYDGPEPTKRGMYRAVLKKLLVREYDSGSVALRGLYELEAAKGDPKKHKQFDGAPYWTNVFFVTATMPMKDGTQRALNNFLKALGVKDNPDIITEDGDANSASGVAIKSIGGKKIAAIEGKTVVTVELSADNRGEGYGLEVNNVYPAKDVEFTSSEEDEDNDAEADEDIEEDVEEGDEVTAEDREEELSGMKLAELRKIASGDHDLETKGLKKDDLIGAILDAEFGEAEEADEDEPEDEDDEEDVEEEADDEDEADDDEEEDEDDEERTARATEIAAFTRVQLKKALKESNPDFTPLKRHSDDDLRAAILDAEFGNTETPF